MNIWFSADYHIDHHNIIKYCGRPFSDITKMKNTIVRNHNALVKEGDIFYYLGDLSLRGPENFTWYKNLINSLNGTKHMILGNHDRLNPFTYVDAGFESVHTALHLSEFDIYLVHDPAVSTVKADKLWLCGHIHNLFKMQSNVINVGVDVWDFKPVSILKILDLNDQWCGTRND